MIGLSSNLSARTWLANPTLGSRSGPQNTSRGAAPRFHRLDARSPMNESPAMRYRIQHTTVYGYEELVSICHNEVHLEPRTTSTQRCRRIRVTIDPTPAVQTSERDYFGNPTAFFTVQEPHHRMIVTSRSDVDV
jgi:hypothetical protein